jgi:hypothetical protein
MEAREVSLLTENARLKKKNIVLAMKVEDLGLAVKNRGTVIKDAIAELDHDSIRWHGRFKEMELLRRRCTRRMRLQEPETRAE